MGKLAKLTAFNTFKIWGGDKLSSIKQITTREPLGETWEVSTHSDGTSLLGDEKLSQFCDLNYLVKFIDTSDNLSIQVHPGNEYAKEHENSKGKTECWIILEAEKNCGIYLGFKPGVTKKEFKTAIENGLDVEKYLNFIEVKPGDFFYVPSGSVHAIGLGVTLCEVQQSSGITYRVWDWNRVDKNGVGRELHIDKAMDVLDFNEKFNQDLLKEKNLFNNNPIQNFVNHPDFKSSLLEIKKDDVKELNLKDKESLVVLRGKLIIDEVEYNAFESGICLNSGMISVMAKDDSIFILTSE